MVTKKVWVHLQMQSQYFKNLFQRFGPHLSAIELLEIPTSTLEQLIDLIYGQILILSGQEYTDISTLVTMFNIATEVQVIIIVIFTDTTI